MTGPPNGIVEAVARRLANEGAAVSFAGVGVGLSPHVASLTAQFRDRVTYHELPALDAQATTPALSALRDSVAEVRGQTEQVAGLLETQLDGGAKSW